MSKRLTPQQGGGTCTQQARELVEQLPGNSLFHAVAFMETLHPDHGAAPEQRFLDRIQQTRYGLRPDKSTPEDQARLDYFANNKKPKLSATLRIGVRLSPIL